MTARRMVPELRHEYKWCADDSKFFAHIDELGGWPVGLEYVGFEHTDTRAAGFTNSPHNDGWWTIVASADDYYLWKLSPPALQRVADAILAAARITKPDLSRLFIKNSRGQGATISRSTP